MEKLIRKIAEQIDAEGGRAFFVGGYVRDHLRGSKAADLDIEVYGLKLAALESLLKNHGKVHAIGRSFGILQLVSPSGVAEFSLPRRDSKAGSGHRGFMVELDPTLSKEVACARRDFTVNAMLMDVLSGEIHDFYGGRADLEKGLLRHTGPAFSEDPLRVYRLMQFAGRFEMSVAPETLELCRQMDLADLSAERVFTEFAKLLLEADRPGIGLEVGRKAGLLRYHPELEAMVGCPQNPEWHPEGDVWTHTMMTVDQAARLRRGDRRLDLAQMFGALCHDMGKPATTVEIDGRIVSPGHCEAGVEPARSFMRRLTSDGDLIDSVEQLVLYHLRPAEFYRVRDEIRPSSIRRLALKTQIDELVLLARADHFGRTTADAIAEDFPAGNWLLERAEDLKIASSAPKPILMGRHLMDRGWQPGPDMGSVLKNAFDAQLEGAFEDLDGALLWLDNKTAGEDSSAAPES